MQDRNNGQIRGVAVIDWHFFTFLIQFNYTLFFVVRTEFIRTPSLRLSQMLRTFLRLKSQSFSNVYIMYIYNTKYYKTPFLLHEEVMEIYVL